MNASRLARLEGQAAALVLFGKDISGVLQAIDKLRGEERPRPGWPREAQARGRRRIAHVRSHVARNVYVAGCEWCSQTSAAGKRIPPDAAPAADPHK